MKDLTFEKILEAVSSMKVSVVLMLAIAVACAAATFIENDFGSNGARAAVYGAFWFEFLIFFFCINLSGRIYLDKMWKIEKLPAFIFHISFIIVVIGAAITRYYGYEGNMRIREGTSSNEILSSESHLIATATFGNTSVSKDWEMRLSALTSNNFTKQISVNDQNFKIEYVKYYPYSMETIADGPGGDPYISLRVSYGSDRQENIQLKRGDQLNTGELMVSFESATVKNPDVEIKHDEGVFFIRANQKISKFSMKEQKRIFLDSGKFHLFEKRGLYVIGNTSLVPMDMTSSAHKKIVPVSGKSGISALFVKVSHNGESTEIALQGAGGSTGGGEMVTFKDGSVLGLRYGSQILKLPFEIFLNDFLLVRYPGSMSPSSYESHVTILDKRNNTQMPYRIYMNNILVHENYRFYQSSYDQDEKGTILSVARDPGKIPTYFGYFLMTLGLTATFFNRKSKFRLVAKQLAKTKNVAAVLFAASVLFLNTELFHTSLQAQSALSAGASSINNDHAKAFSRLVVQDVQGRLKPMDSLAMEVINKVSRTRSIDGLNYNQIVLGMMADPFAWSSVQMISVSLPEVKRILGVPLNRKYISFDELFDTRSTNQYKIGMQLNDAMRKNAADRSKKDKEIIALNEKANIAYLIRTGNMFRLFPVPRDPNQTWYDVKSLEDSFGPSVAEAAKNMLGIYLSAVNRAMKSGNWAEADQALNVIRDYQVRYGESVMPSPTKIRYEIIFNKFNIFERLMPFYMIIGLLHLVFSFYILLKERKESLPFEKISLGLHGLLFVVYTFGLGLRWYVSGHAPWSNGYESLVYIAWATSLAGLVFSKQSVFVLAATSMLTGFALFGAHLSWMDPEITNLVPVLKSYWLTLHVSVITASYGFFALTAILGFIVLTLFILRTKERPRVDYSIRELTRIGELSLLIGLAMLSIGNLLGAIWANESWGRYWSWDPKETWTLITILVYSAVGHWRYVPGLRSRYFFALFSTLAYFSVLMTYFGVNYYLSGLHSYAAGDPVPVPSSVYYTLAVIAIVAGFAFVKRDPAIPLKSVLESDAAEI